MPVIHPCQLSHVLCQAARLKKILEQRDKMIKEGKYVPPDYHSSQQEPKP